MTKTVKPFMVMSSLIALFAISSSADVIDLNFSRVYPGTPVLISGPGEIGNYKNVYAGQYLLQHTGVGTPQKAFCVDPTWIKEGEISYNIVKPSLVNERLVKAAWLWETYASEDNLSLSGAVSTQIAIWEVTWENENTGYDLSGGDFKLHNDYTSGHYRDKANNMLAELSNLNLTDFNNFKTFADNNFRVVVSDQSQNFLIRHHSVPEAGTLMMFLTGLASLGVVYRKKIVA